MGRDSQEPTTTIASGLTKHHWWSNPPQDGAPKIAFSCLVSGLTIVYGRYGGFQKWGYLQIIHFNWIFPQKNHLLWGTPMTMEPPI